MVEISTTGDLRARLQSLLDEKEKQLQHAGTLGQRVLEQQMELEERVSQLRDLEADREEEDDVDGEMREYFRALADTVNAWDAENAKLSTAVAGAPVNHSPNQSYSTDFSAAGDMSREEPERGSKHGPPPPKSRRERNAEHRQNDVEFAFEIGSGLLTEVRRLQSLLGERDKAIQEMKEEKDDLEKVHEALATALKQQEASADKFREENWNLEVQLQEIRKQFSDTQATAQRLEGEHKRLTKELSKSRETSDHHKTEAERIQTVLDELKGRHETDVAQARKTAASLQREKADLQQTLDATKQELTRQSRRLIPRFGTPHTPGGRNGFTTPGPGEEEDVFGGMGGLSTRARKMDGGLFGTNEFGDYPGDDEPDPSPTRSRAPGSGQPGSELESLQQKLAHAQRQITTLKNTLQREKEQKIEYRRKLEAAPPIPVPGADEADTWEDDESDEHAGKAKARKTTPFKVGRGRGRGGATRGRGRGRGGLTLSDRFSLAGQQPESDEDDEELQPHTAPVPTSLRNIFSAEEDDEVYELNGPEPSSPLAARDVNRTSVDGMDPAFANILRRPASASATERGSPFHAPPSRGGSFGRRRGGAAFQEIRPPSFAVGQPGALALELGLGGDESISKEPSKPETREFGCQTEVEEEPSFANTTVQPEPEPAPVLPVKEYAETSIQVEPEPAPVVPPPPAKEYAETSIQVEPKPVPVIPLKEMSSQTEPEPMVAHAETAVQYDFVEPVPVVAPPPPPPIMAESSSQTDVAPEVVRSDMGTQHAFVAPVFVPVPTPAPVPVVRVESGMLTEPEEKPVQRDADTQTPAPVPVPIVLKTNADTQTPLPAPVPVITKADADMQTIAIPVPVIAKADVDTQTVPVPVVVIAKADADVQTVHVPVPVATMASVDVQTTAIDVPALARINTGAESSDQDTSESRERRTTLTQRDLHHARLVAAATSPDTTLTLAGVSGRPHGVLEESDVEDDGTQTETGAESEAETETDMDDYHDARSASVQTPSTDFRRYLDSRQSLSLHTPTESVGDFHSIMTVTDNDFPDSDQDSIRASIIPSRNASTQAFEDESSPIEEVDSRSPSPSPLPSPIEPTTPPPPPRTFEDKGVSAEITIEQPKVEETVAPPAPLLVAKEEPPKLEQKEISIQTDEWLPPPPPRLASVPSPLASATPILVPIPIAASQSTPGLQRLGSSQGFQFIPPAALSSPVSAPRPMQTTPSTTPARDVSMATIRPRTSASERRVSIESAMSSMVDDNGRMRTTSGVADRSRPPVMIMPPPPRLPPPPKSAGAVPSPTSSMLPPPFIPEHRRGPTASNASDDGPPPRPSSPPPPELIKRATTPLLGVPSRQIFGRHNGSSPPAHHSMRQLPSTSSFRSAAAAMQHGGTSGPSSLLAPVSLRSHPRREMSQASFVSGESMGSPRSSISSDHGGYARPTANGDGTPGRPSLANGDSVATDPSVIHAITQTMIGEFLYKYTRRAIGKGHGERRHKRFFWVHPYTKTLYWGSADPGSANVAESTAKSAFIDGVRSVLDPNPMPPGLYQYSIIVSTPQREMKFTAPTKERHDIWFSALQYLLTRPDSVLPSPGNGQLPRTPLSVASGSHELYEDNEDLHHNDLSFNASPSRRHSVQRSVNMTPRNRRSVSQMSFRGSIGKRAGTPAAEFLRWNDGPLSSPDNTVNYANNSGRAEDEEDDEEELDFELNEHSLQDPDGFEGLDNVRACCDGKHTVGHSHHHHHAIGTPLDPPSPTRAPSRNRGRLLNASETERPISPSGWSMRSRTGSTHSTGFFSRFGSRRSAKVPVDR